MMKSCEAATKTWRDSRLCLGKQAFRFRQRDWTESNAEGKAEPTMNTFPLMVLEAFIVNNSSKGQDRSKKPVS